MSVFEVQDCCHEINSHLSLIQLLTVRKYRLWHTKPISIRNIIIRRLMEFGHTHDIATDLLNSILDTKSILSGAFMLMVLITPMDQPLNVDPFMLHTDINIYTDNLNSNCGTSLMRSFGVGEEGLKICRMNKTAFTMVLEKHKLKETRFRSGFDVKNVLFGIPGYDFFKIAYDGVNLSVKMLESVLTYPTYPYRDNGAEVTHTIPELQAEYSFVIDMIHQHTYSMPSIMDHKVYTALYYELLNSSNEGVARYTEKK